MAFGSVDVSANDETQVEASQKITNGDFIFTGNKDKGGILSDSANPANTLLLTVGGVIVIGLIAATFLVSKGKYPINKKTVKKAT